MYGILTEAHQIKLTILETSDIHGNILPIQYATNQPIERGLAKIATVIKKEREKEQNLILIDNGDLLQGSPLSYFHARIDNQPRDPMVTILSHLKYDAAVPGNHEFNYGPEVLRKAIGESDFPWLSANVLDKETDKPAFGKPYLIKVLENGLRIGIIGITTHYIPHWENPKHIEQFVFHDALEALRSWVSFVKEKENVDVLLVSYHGGFERDLDDGNPTEPLNGENQGYQICQELSEIDVLLTGHQHRRIAGKLIGKTLVVQPGAQGAFIGKVSLFLEKHGGKWKITKKNAELLSVEAAIPDPQVLQIVQPYEARTQSWLDQPIGKVIGDMTIQNPMDVWLKDHPFIEFINKVQMTFGKADISSTALFDHQSAGFSSHVTMRDIVSNYIYPNTLRVLRLTGQDIKDALERSASFFKTYTGGEIEINPAFTTPKPQHYNYDMWEGIDYLINISRPIGERIVTLSYKGKPLEMDGEYEVVMNNYRAVGGGDYPMYVGKPVVRDILIDVSELIANYILEKGSIHATLNNNWKVIVD